MLIYFCFNYLWTRSTQVKHNVYTLYNKSAKNVTYIVVTSDQDHHSSMMTNMPLMSCDPQWIVNVMDWCMLHYTRIGVTAARCRATVSRIDDDPCCR